MNIYKLTQNIVVNRDSYVACIVVAKNEDEARKIHPSEFVKEHKEVMWMGIKENGEYYQYTGKTWPEFIDRDQIEVKLIGSAFVDSKPGLILASKEW